jgi:hypothetical protein
MRKLSLQEKLGRKVILLLIIISTIAGSFTLIITTKTSAQSSCPLKNFGDTDCSGTVDLLDFSKFREEYILFQKGQLQIANALSNFNQDQSLDLSDFVIFKNNLGRTSTTGTPTIKLTTTTVPTVTTTSSPPPVGPSKGVWISPEEIMKLPMSGSAWDKMVSATSSDVTTACLYDNNCPADVDTLAIAIVAVRKNDSALRAKAIGGLQAAMKSKYSRALELSRGLQTYIIAADILGYHDSGFESWVRSALTANISGHSGGSGVYGTAIKSANNWGGHARASLAAAAIYLNDQKMITDVVNAHKAFIGLSAPNQLVYDSTNWHADSSNKAGINRKGAIISGKNVSGVLPEDWRRASGFTWPPGITGYMWEGIQGLIVTAVILHRANLVPFNAGDNAMIRSIDILYGTGEAASNSPVFKNPASGDDTWIPWVVNYYGGTSFPTQAASPGKNMGWTDWTHAK